MVCNHTCIDCRRSSVTQDFVLICVKFIFFNNSLFYSQVSGEKMIDKMQLLFQGIVILTTSFYDINQKILTY